MIEALIDLLRRALFGGEDGDVELARSLAADPEAALAAAGCGEASPEQVREAVRSCAAEAPAEVGAVLEPLVACYGDPTAISAGGRHLPAEPAPMAAEIATVVAEVAAVPGTPSAVVVEEGGIDLDLVPPVVEAPPAPPEPVAVDLDEPVLDGPDPVELPAAEEPEVEAPVAEEPPVEELPLEEPTAEEPVAEVPVDEEPPVEEPPVEELPLEEPTAEEPVEPPAPPVVAVPPTPEAPPVDQPPVVAVPPTPTPEPEVPVGQEVLVPPTDPVEVPEPAPAPPPPGLAIVPEGGGLAPPGFGQGAGDGTAAQGQGVAEPADPAAPPANPFLPNGPRVDPADGSVRQIGVGLDDGTVREVGDLVGIADASLGQVTDGLSTTVQVAEDPVGAADPDRLPQEGDLLPSIEDVGEGDADAGASDDPDGDL